MSAALIIGVGLLGGLGATLRFLLDGAVAGRLSATFPVGTLTVNLLGAFVLGVLAGVGLGHDVRLLAATGLLGALTTFSTWMLESERLGEEGLPGRALANLLLSLALGVVLAWLGTQIGGAL